MEGTEQRESQKVEIAGEIPKDGLILLSMRINLNGILRNRIENV